MKLIRCLILPILLASSTMVSRGQTLLGISFDISGSANLAAYDTLPDGTVVRTGSNGSDIWNQVTVAAGTGPVTFPNLTQADGTATTASITVGRRNAVNLGGAYDITGKPGATDDYAMMDGCFLIDGDDGDVITVSGLPASLAASGYVVNFHSTHADTRLSTFTIDGISASSQQATNATFDGDFNGYTASVPVAPGTTGFTATWTANAGNPNRLNLAGISISPPLPPRLIASQSGFWDEIIWNGDDGDLSGGVPDGSMVLVGRYYDLIYRGQPAVESLATLSLGENSVNPGQGTLRVRSGQLQVTGNLSVGRNYSPNDSFLHLDGGSLEVGGNAEFGRNGASADGSLILSGGSFVVDGDLAMGDFTRGGSMIRLHNPGSNPVPQVDGALILDRCSLDLTFDSGYSHSPGSTITVATFGTRQGQFLNFRHGEEFNCGPNRFRIEYDAVPGEITLTALENWAAGNTRPNIILIFADDQGFSDLSLNGDPGYPMPNLDTLASDGVRFTDAYVTGGVCHPSRCGILTGRYQQRYGNEGNLPNPSTDGMAVRQHTVPRLLQGLGYRTYGIGKWHLGFNVEYHPNLRGFGQWYGMWAGARSYYAATNEINVFQNQMKPDFDPEQSPVYVTDRIGNKAVDMIDEHLTSSPGDPFFMYLSFTAVHAPMDINPADPRFARLQSEFGLTAADYAGSPYIFPGSDGATVDRNRYELAAMTLAMDENIGKVLDKLDDEEIANDTLVVYMNDNGGAGWTAQYGGNYSYNTPFRGFKGADMTEGSIRVPCAARWPGMIPAGQTVTAPVNGLDWSATFVNAGGDAPAAARNGLEGLDLIPLLAEAEPLPDERVLLWRAGGSNDGGTAVRQGKWKLHIDDIASVSALYDLSTDPGETTDLSAAEPDLFTALQQRLEAWETRLQPSFYNSAGDTVKDASLVRWGAAGGLLMRGDSATPLWQSGSMRHPLSAASDFAMSFRIQASEASGYAAGSGLWAGLGETGNRASLIRMGIDFQSNALTLVEGSGGAGASTPLPPVGRQAVTIFVNYTASSGTLELRLGSATTSLVLSQSYGSFDTMAVGVSAMEGEVSFPHVRPSRAGQSAIQISPPGDFASLAFSLAAEGPYGPTLEASSDLSAFAEAPGALLESLGGGVYRARASTNLASRGFYRLNKGP